jgi:hypothetical protein
MTTQAPFPRALFPRALFPGAAAIAATAALAAAGARGGTPPLPPASAFSARVDNPWYPLVPGTRYVSTGVKDGRPARDVMTVTHRTKTIAGVPCVVVADRLYLSGRLAERTTDWYTQDRRGNVWYFGEQTAELDAQGAVTSTEGSWRAGADGAKPGIFMPARPRTGRSYRQEFYEGHAEDHFRIAGSFATVTPPAGANALLTEEWTPLEPGVIDHKVYVRGIGQIVEQTVRGGDEHLTLISLRRGP